MAFPLYVVQNNNNGKEEVFHQVHLLLWIAVDADMDDSVRSNPAIAVQVANGSVDGDTSDTKGVPLNASYGLSLVMFRTVLGSPYYKTGRKAEAPLSRGGTEWSWPGNLCFRG